MNRDELIKSLLALKQKNLGKRPVSIVMDKLKQQVTDRLETDGRAWKWPYRLIQETPEGEELLADLGRCERCNDPAWDQYVGPSDSTYCSADCAWDSDDGWDQCVNCGEDYDYNGSYGVSVEGEGFCSADCFWQDLISTTRRALQGHNVGWPGVTDFFEQHPDLDVNRMQELWGKVRPWELIDNPEPYLKKLYGLSD